MAWYTIGIYYHSAISAFSEPHHHHKASNHPILSKLMHHFYLRIHLNISGLIHEHLLSLLESWTPGSSLTNFKLVWKMAIILALVTAKCFSVITLLCMISSPLFFSVILLFIFWHLIGRQINPVIYHLKFVLNLSMLILACLLHEGLPMLY